MRSSSNRIRNKKRNFVIDVVAEKDMGWLNHDKTKNSLKREVYIGVFKLREIIEGQSIEYTPKYGFFHSFDIYLPR